MPSECLNIITNSVWSAIIKFMFLVYLIHQKTIKKQGQDAWDSSTFALSYNSSSHPLHTKYIYVVCILYVMAVAVVSSAVNSEKAKHSSHSSLCRRSSASRRFHEKSRSLHTDFQLNKNQSTFIISYCHSVF